MASRKELEALITLAGKVDPSLKRALQQVESDSRRTQSQLSQMSAASNKLVSGLVKTGLAAGAAIGTGSCRCAESIFQSHICGVGPRYLIGPYDRTVIH